MDEGVDDGRSLYSRPVEMTSLELSHFNKTSRSRLKFQVIALIVRNDLVSKNKDNVFVGESLGLHGAQHREG